MIELIIKEARTNEAASIFSTKYSFEIGFLILTMPNLFLNMELRGFVLNLYPQHGHQNESHFMNISQT
jgi:hypothetical protein